MANTKQYDKRTKKHFENIANTYDQSGDGKFVAPMYAGIIKELRQIYQKKYANPVCNEKLTLLDLGCGTGNLITFLEKEFPFSITGVDLCDNMIAEASKRFSNDDISFQIANVESLPFEDEAFDFIICNASFHHYTNPKQSLSEVYRVLKKGGTFIIGELTYPKWMLPFVNFSIKFSNHGDYHMYGIQEMKKLLETFDFHVMNIAKITRCRFSISVQK